MKNTQLAKQLFTEIRDAIQMIIDDHNANAKDISDFHEIEICMPTSLDIDGDRYYYHDLFGGK